MKKICTNKSGWRSASGKPHPGPAPQFGEIVTVVEVIPDPRRDNSLYYVLAEYPHQTYKGKRYRYNAKHFRDVEPHADELKAATPEFIEQLKECEYGQ